MKIIYFVHNISLFLTLINGADILVIFPTTAQSHYRIVRPLIRGLLDRGHNVLSITNFPEKNDRSNLTYINISGLKSHTKFGAKKVSIVSLMVRMINTASSYKKILDFQPVANLLKSGRKFDLVIAEMFTTTPIFAPIASVVDAPIIGINPMVTLPWADQIFGVPNIVSYMPNIAMNMTDMMSFYERNINMGFNIIYHGLLNWLYAPNVQKINEQFYGINTPTLLNAMANISLIFVNSHHSIYTAQPRAPGIVEIGGIHVLDAIPIPQDLKDYIETSEFGVIIFSLGSIVSADSITREKLNCLFFVFSKLKQRVIMKFDSKINVTIPSNVKIVKWFPQRDLLAHPKVLLFITHGGLMSIIETIHCGKPVVGIPMFGDQPINIRFLEQKKVAVYVEYEDLNIEYFYGAIKTALSDDFRKNMKKLQLQYFDRPQTPLETAIYWAEYVIQNRGVSPSLLKTNQHDLCWTKTYLLDVVAFLIFLITLTCYVTFYVLNKIIINTRQWFEDSSKK